MRYRDATWRPCSKHGYPGNDTHLHQGLVIHSAEGSLAGLFSVLDGSREASWHFSVTQGGMVYQHVDTNNIAWTNGSQDANQRFWGIECEGGGPGMAGEPLFEPQYQALLGVVRWLWDTHDLSVYRRHYTLFEHREMVSYGAAATSCPSGRIPWTRLISDLEDNMTDAEVIELIKTHGPGAIYDALGSDGYSGLKRRIRTTAHPDGEQHGGEDSGLKRGDKVTLQ